MAATLQHLRAHRNAAAKPFSIIDRRVDDADLRLGRAEQWLLNAVRRQGTIRFVLTVTLAIMLVSVCVTVAAMGFFFGLEDGAIVPALVLSVGIPALVAPPSLHVTVRLASRLDTAGKSLRVAALTDPLTGVLNRRGFFEAVDEVARLDRDVAVAMVDVDEFKTINDRHGHAVGDLVLTHVADWIVALVGEAGVVSRIGGDEFAFVIPSEKKSTLPDRHSMVIEGFSFSITIGSSTFTAGEQFEQALARADADLYGLKRVSPQLA